MPAGYLELYTLAVEMADRVSARRGIANTFFVTVNTALASLLGGEELRWYGPAAGIVICVTWWALLRSYRDLNAAKFGVILAMEERMPAKLFGDEWAQLKLQPVEPATRAAALRSPFERYRELGRIERLVPWVFALIYVAEIIRQVS